MEVEALDLATGDVDWQAALGQFASFTAANGAAYLAVDSGKVFVDWAASVPPDGVGTYLAAFDEASGASVWGKFIPGEWTGVPTAQGGVIYLNANGFVDAIQESTGKLLWSILTPIAGAVTIANGTIVVSDGCGIADGIDLSNGIIK